MSWMRTSLRALGHLFYPHLCVACEGVLANPKQFVCLTCRSEWPLTDMHRFRENTFTERFWGRVPLQFGSAMFHFVKGGQIQSLIHALKYRSQPQVGTGLGREYGRILSDSYEDAKPDLIIPVPLHPKKKHKRGYNQAARFGEGLAHSLQIPMVERFLVRSVYQTSQTQKGRLERFQNVLAAFQARHLQQLKGKHILLVDDVLTTGATLEACAIQLQGATDAKISMATIAIAQL